MTKEQIMKIVHNNIKEIAEKTTLGSNNYYQRIVWEIDNEGELHDHWLGGNESILCDCNSFLFSTKIENDTGYILLNCYDDEHDSFDNGKEKLHADLIDEYKNVLLQKNIIDKDGFIIDENDLTTFIYNEFWLNQSCDYLLEIINDQIEEKFNV